MIRVLLTFLVISPTCAEALENMNICYILDGILIFYGIILTILYCRLRVFSANKAADKPEKQPSEAGIYAGLSCQTSDTYETIKRDKRSMEV